MSGVHVQLYVSLLFMGEEAVLDAELNHGHAGAGQTQLKTRAAVGDLPIAGGGLIS